ncbi:phosphatase PAP2 family protein [Parasulfuritortus cantonensis]|uniref:Phosphatase PAP2 family protein n=1 Tax=Parasulfuritortus cantonensis TaxID=2528202 RepID=A0A4R1BCA7_9PROT|nr:phosphatase PAP2 family protein [Parasulfuritortus cantonensis]TCJ14666.1 phosphatase PAP2 family protein [Parasulfuritortus cantonensis]
MARLLPHEWLFGAYLALTWLRLVAAQGVLGGDALIYLAGLGLAAGLAVWGERRATATAWRWRLLYYPVAMNLYFQEMRNAIPALTAYRFDADLRAIDRILLPDSPAFLLQPYANPALTELFSLAYLLFFPYLLFSLIYYFVGELPRLKAFVAGLFSLYGIGFLGYTLVPAAGPYLAYDFAAPLAGGQLTAWNAELVRQGSIGVDVFPSLHVAVSGYLLGFDFRHKRRRFWAYLGPCVLLWLSTQYLRYHYFIDVLAGVALALFALRVAERQYRLERIDS